VSLSIAEAAAATDQHLGAIDRKIGIYAEKTERLDLERTPSA
jgi:hypothetical protein